MHFFQQLGSLWFQKLGDQHIAGAGVSEVCRRDSMRGRGLRGQLPSSPQTLALSQILQHNIDTKRNVLRPSKYVKMRPAPDPAWGAYDAPPDSRLRRGYPSPYIAFGARLSPPSALLFWGQCPAPPIKILSSRTVLVLLWFPRWLRPQGHHLSSELKTPKTRNRKMAAAEVYK